MTVHLTWWFMLGLALGAAAGWVAVQFILSAVTAWDRFRRWKGSR
jgi:hypothetical protein